MIGFILYSLLSGPDYQNDDYVPPPPGTLAPFPDAQVSEVDTLLTANPLYAQTLPVPVRCDLTNPDLHLPSATDDEVKAYIDDLMACNMRVWDQPFQGTQRFQLVRPAVNIYRDSAQTPCGSFGPNGLYCSANQQVYFSRLYPEIHPNLAVTNEPHVIDEIMSHEFAHGIQARTVLLVGGRYKERQAANEAQGREFARRVELQADCFAGMFLQSVHQSVGYTETDFEQISRAMRASGDDELANRPNDPAVRGGHGHGVSRLYWLQVGLTSTDVGRCNTFTAPSDYVR